MILNEVSQTHLPSNHPTPRRTGEAIFACLKKGKQKGVAYNHDGAGCLAGNVEGIIVAENVTKEAYLYSEEARPRNA